MYVYMYVCMYVGEWFYRVIIIHTALGKESYSFFESIKSGYIYFTCCVLILSYSL